LELYYLNDKSWSAQGVSNRVTTESKSQYIKNRFCGS
jgi:hypothetical protein